MSTPGDLGHSVAIVGMAAVFPGAGDLSTYWSNMVDGVDAITEVPSQRWDAGFYDPDDPGPDRFYCRRGGFVDGLVRFDPTKFQMMPAGVQGTEPDQLIALAAAQAAVEDAGGIESMGPSERLGVVLGRGGYIGAGQARLDLRTRVVEQLVRSVEHLVPDLAPGEVAALRQELRRRAGWEVGEDAIGLVPNLAASRIANRFDLLGPAFTVDAACASSLVALQHAVTELASGRCDAMIAGGVHHCHDLTLWSVFSQLGAISRRGEIRPFDREADGLLIGEGTGMVVLKRLEDAERQGQRIYAVIRGIGVASDGRGTTLMRPSCDGQVLSMQRAWEAAGAPVQTVGLVEAHGTGTPTGDQTELGSLAKFFGPSDGHRVPLGSVKSMIGHAMPAAGIAGLIKVALSLYHRVLPPTLHCDEPLEILGATRFRVSAEAEPWEATEVPRRAGVNAFGFGGVNAHLVVEEHGAARRAVARARHRAVGTSDARGSKGEHHDLVLCAADDPSELLAQLECQVAGKGAQVECDPKASSRLAVVDPDPKRIAFARNVVERGEPWRGRLDVWFTTRPLAARGGMALVFPGLEANFAPEVESVAQHLGTFAPRSEEADGLGSHGLAVLALGRLLERAVVEMGVRPQVVAGHSIGEWSGMLAAGMVPPEAQEPYLATLDPARMEVPDLVFAAVGCGAPQAGAAIEDLNDIVVSHDNCPHQSIVCGIEASVDQALERLRSQRVLCERLPFRSGFHTPMFGPYLERVAEGLQRLDLQAPRIPLWSATTCAPYPKEPEAVRALALRHLTEPVRFRSLIEALYDHGIRAFVQMGVGSLVGFINDTLRGKDHLALPAAGSGLDGTAQLRRVAAGLWVEGYQVDTAAGVLGIRPDTMAPPTGPLSRPVDLSAPLLSLDGLALPCPRQAPATSNVDPRHAPPRTPAATRDLGRTERSVSVQEMGWLVDHCLFRQPSRWPFLSDRFPVVPLTTMISWLAEAAASANPGQVVVGLERVRAQRWLAAEPPVAVNITQRPESQSRIKVAIEGYAQGAVLLERGSSSPPAPALHPADDWEPSEISARALYGDRWMFHGPSFQSVCRLTSIGASGVRGELRALQAPGSLLDGAGQLVGYWVMARTDQDRIALPTGVERIEFFAPEPPPGAVVECTAVITSLEHSSVSADLELVHQGRVWARIFGWSERRFETDEQIWSLHRFPEYSWLSEARPGGWVLTRERWGRTASRDVIARHYLTEPEREHYEARSPLAQRQWLLGRIAAKDAVREWLWRHGAGALFPSEVLVTNGPGGAPMVHGAFGDSLSISLAHSGPLAVAAVRCGAPVGIDVEQVVARSERFAHAAMCPEELRLVRPHGERELTQVWVAKEAVAKRTGRGLGGDPRQFQITQVELPTLSVGDVSVDTETVTHEGSEFVVGWTAH